MFAAINLLVFILLTGFAFLVLISKPSYLKLSRREKVLLTGREKFLLLTLVTGMVEVGGVSIGLNLSAWRLLIWIAMILMAFLLYRRSPGFKNFTFIYILFIGWLLLSFVWTENIGFGIRASLKYIYPLLIMLFSMTFVRSKEFIFVVMKWMVIAAFTYSLFLGGFTKQFAGLFFYFGGLFWPGATFADFLGIASGISYLMWWRTKEKKYLYLIGWFLLSSIFDGVRTGLIAIFSVFMVASYLRYKVTSIPYIVFVIFFAIASVVFVPQIRDKMFYDPQNVTSISDIGEVSTEQINSNGRFAMWGWALQEYYDDNKLTGAGIGALQERMYSGNHPFGRMKIIHNDYVQLLCDTGLVGLILYLMFVFLAVKVALRYINKQIPQYLSNVSFLVIVSFTAVLATMMTDNVVNYAFAVHSYPFVFVGIMIAYRKIYKLEKRMRSFSNESVTQ